MTRIEADDKLVEQIKKAHPELERMSAADIADWAMRMMLHQKGKEKGEDANS